jgi:hypothetical protein
MNKEFIPYEQALELTALGFNEECLAVVNVNSYEFKIINGSYNEELYLPIPLYQQAFRWFREKYDLTGLIHLGSQEFSFSINKDGRRISTLKEYLDYNGSYEEAELACLKKLIEIVKNK